jgi:7-keto-8-aminopelargonate synthetase-like enzyme
VQTRRATHHERTIDVVASQFHRGIAHGLARVRVEDQSPTGESITIDGRKLLNFGSCAYLGLNVDPRIKDAAIRAIEHYGPVFSSSAAYTSVDLYTALEEKLTRIFGGTVLVPTTTTLGHLSALPVLVSPDDLVLLDRQVHASVQLASEVLKAEGATVATVPHNDIDALAQRVSDASARYDRVWYLADGVYSMYGDTAPVSRFRPLLDQFENLHVYFDDAHGVGWHGVHGRGWVLTEMELHQRLVLAASLSKSWGTGGAVLVFPDGALAERVLLAGPTFIFSGPVHPAELGAAVAAADIHLSAEHADRQARLMRQIDRVRDRIVELQLPVKSLARTPIWFVRIGSMDNAIEACRRLMDSGFYVNLASFPAVPMGEDGFRFTQTLYHSDQDLDDLLDAISEHISDLVVFPEGEIDLR